MTRRAPGGTVLAISPHLDDAVMSAGATLAALVDAGHRVIVGTVFAGEPKPPWSPAAEAFHTDCGLNAAKAMDRRRREDLCAMGVLGTQAVHLPFLDAIYRRTGDGWLCPVPGSLFRPDPPAEPALAATIAACVGRLAKRTAAVAVWTAAAVGGHVDHRIVRAAVELASHAEVWRTVFWEDLPYALDTEPGGDHGRPFAGVDKHPKAKIRNAHLERKLAAVARYTSQVRMLWPDDEDWRGRFRDHAIRRRRYGGPELLWSTRYGRRGEPVADWSSGGR